MRFLVDENMPRLTVSVLKALGHDVEDVREIGLRGATDRSIFQHACAHDRVLITRDMDFADTARYPPGTHPGIIVLRLPEDMEARAVVRSLAQALQVLSDQSLQGALIIVEPNRVRVRR